jgi:LmbE family N-acetylglucosaminyl deacetylase
LKSILTALLIATCLPVANLHLIAHAELPVPDSRDKMIASLAPVDILAVFAHPDDETFASGTFTKLSANGQRIQLVYATSGDAGGDLTGQGLKGEALAKHREAEMRQASRILKVSAEPLFLRYPDGFVRDNWGRILADVGSIMQLTKPKIVVTFGPDGYYGHSDHLAISQITERAFDDLGISSNLLHVAIPRSLDNLIVQSAGVSRYKPVDDKYITYKVNVRDQIEQRIGAMKAHASQFDDQIIEQMRSLGTATGIEGFVEVRNLGQAGTLSTIFTEGDDAD